MIMKQLISFSIIILMQWRMYIKYYIYIEFLLKKFCYLKLLEMIDISSKVWNFQLNNSCHLAIRYFENSKTIFKNSFTSIILLEDVDLKKIFISKMLWITWNSYHIGSEQLKTKQTEFLSEKFKDKSILDSLETTFEVYMIEKKFLSLTSYTILFPSFILLFRVISLHPFVLNEGLKCQNFE